MEDIIAFILATIIVIGLGSLIFWGIGNLVIFVFHIDYTWTFLHGFATDLVFLALKGIFNK